MVRPYLMLPLAALGSGCAVLPSQLTPSWLPFVGGESRPASDGLRAQIAEGVTLTLPTPPGYPQERTIVQTGRAQFGDRRAVFDAVLTLGPERTEIVLAMPAGPRLSTIVWDSTGVHEDRAPFVPDSLPVENILADIFVTVWPEGAVAKALPEDVTLDVGADGARTMHRGDDIILTVSPDPNDPHRVIVHNEALGYQVAIEREDDSAAAQPAPAPAEAAPVAEAKPAAVSVVAHVKKGIDVAAAPQSSATP